MVGLVKIAYDIALEAQSKGYPIKPRDVLPMLNKGDVTSSPDCECWVEFGVKANEPYIVFCSKKPGSPVDRRYKPLVALFLDDWLFYT